MTLSIEEIEKLPVEEKAELYHLLGNDAELDRYLFSDSRLFEELARRDTEVEKGNITTMTRTELSNLLKARRDGL